MAYIISREHAQTVFDRIPLETSISSSYDIPVFSPSCQQVEDWWNSDKRIKLLLGGNQSGKSTTGGAYVAAFARDHPNSLVWAVGLDFDRTRICFLKLQEYLAEEEIHLIVWASRNKGIAHSVRLTNGCEIVFKSAAAGFMKFEGDKVDLVWIDEEIKDKQVLHSCLARTTMTQGQTVLTMTPLQGKTWLYYDYVDKQHPNVFHTTMTLYDNPYLPKEQIDQMLSIYSPREIPYRVFGKWGIVEGIIYEEFSEETHVIPFDEAIVKRCNTVLRALDFGRTVACVWLGIDDYENLYILGDLKLVECYIEDFAALIEEKEFEIGLRPLQRRQDIITYTDHAFQERFELERYGIDCIPADKAVEVGIETVRRRLKVQEDKKVNLHILDNCQQTVDELNDYQYDKAPLGKEPSGKPRKLNDHLSDCLRYAVVAADDYCEFRYDQYFESAVKSEL